MQILVKHNRQKVRSVYFQRFSLKLISRIIKHCFEIFMCNKVSTVGRLSESLIYPKVKTVKWCFIVKIEILFPFPHTQYKEQVWRYKSFKLYI